MAAVDRGGADRPGPRGVSGPRCQPASETGAAAGRGGHPGVGVAGFGEVGFRVENPFLPVAVAGRTRCALLASTASQRSQGLMHRRSLAGYDGTVFEFGESTTDGFYMKDTVIPLSIAWFTQGGRFVNSTTMAPCPKSTASCPANPGRGAVQRRPRGRRGSPARTRDRRRLGHHRRRPLLSVG